ncbi:MAG: hypothetical protein ACRDH8_06345 [Actinomycetota bacterium]
MNRSIDLRFPTRTEDHAGPVTPGERMTVDFSFQPLDAVVPAGARLVLVLGQGSAYNRLPSAPSFPVELHFGGDAGSLTVTRIRPRPGRFFVPPD